ncbi:MAG: DUF6172 family protein [Planctomycetota bacterium]
MKKTFPLRVADGNPQRQIESIKGEIKKYLKREQRKTLPEGMDVWRFDCAVAIDDGPRRELRPGDLKAAVDEAVAGDGEQLYVEILARPAVRSASSDDDQQGD